MHPGLPPLHPLHRAFPTEQAANRLVSDRVCKPLRGTIQGHHCDEYPFAATKEGAASGPQGVNWDVRLVPAGHNLRVGGLLSAFYQDQRMRYGEPFFVVLTP